jgi:hypothetical protein
MGTTSTHRGLDQLKHPTLTKEDIEAFCAGAGFRFCFLGEPDNLDSNEVFRAGSQDWPTRGVTIKFETVVEWKEAIAELGPEITEGGNYVSYLGEKVTTVTEAFDTENECSVIVYREQGKHFTIPRDQFFRVVNHEEKLMPRYKYIG